MQILISGGSELTRRILANSLHTLGYSAVTICGTGEYLLQEFEREAADLIIIEKQLTDMPGLALVKRLRAMDGAEDVSILMTGSEFVSQEVVTAIRAGIDDLLLIPYQPEQLNVKISRLLPSRKR